MAEASEAEGPSGTSLPNASEREAAVKPIEPVVAHVATSEPEPGASSLAENNQAADSDAAPDASTGSSTEAGEGGEAGAGEAGAKRKRRRRRKRKGEGEGQPAHAQGE